VSVELNGKEYDLGETFEQILLYTRQYNMTSEEPAVAAVQIWLDYFLGNYDRVRAQFENDIPFMRKFVKLRCRRERTIQTRRWSCEITGEPIEWATSNNPSPEEEVLAREYHSRVEALKNQLEHLEDPRELIVVKMLMEGATRRQIKDCLGCSLGTVQNLVVRLRDRPAIQSLYELVYEFKVIPYKV